MRLNFRKVSAIAASALMMGLTMGVAAAASYPAPFVSGAGANVAVVYGTGSGVSSLDLVQAGNIQANLQSYMSSGGGTSTTSVSGGDSKILSSPTRNLYYGDAISVPLSGSALTRSELPTILADGTFMDLSGNSYGYSQYVKPGSATVTFGSSEEDIDPMLYINAGTTAGQLYNYTLSFSKNLNVSDATSVQGQKIKILGVDYIIGASSTNSTLYLYGSGTTITVAGKETQTVSVGGIDHTVELVTTSGTGATISVDGVRKSVVKGSNYAFAGGINVYVKDIIHPSYETDTREVELIVGASSLQLNNLQAVKKGAEGSYIQGTLATINAAGVGIISGFTVQVAAARSQNDSIALGQSFVDPVFGGLKLTLANVVPGLDSATRGKIVVDGGSSTTTSAYVTFTSALARAAGEEKLQYVYDNDTAPTATQPLLARSSQPNAASGRGIIHVLEGENARVDDWIIVNQGDQGTILEVVNPQSNVTDTTAEVTFKDVICAQGGLSGCETKVTLTFAGQDYSKTGITMFGGSGYNIYMNGAGSLVNVTWSSAARTLFPRIKLASGGWIAFLTQTTITNGTNVIFPDGQATLATTGTQVLNGTTSYTPNGIQWTLRASATVMTSNVSGIASPTCNFNSTMGPAILYIEPKKWDDSSYGNFICVPLAIAGSSYIAIGDPVFNGTSSTPYLSYRVTDQYKKAVVDKYGSYVVKEDRTNMNGVATIYYPSSQMYFDAVFSLDTASIVGGTTTVSGAQLGDVLVKDSEVSSVSSKNLIVVGGSCINTVASTLLGGAGCGADFTDKTGVGSGQFLIQSLASTYSSGSVALVVAGYEAADTVNAAIYLRTKAVDTTVGKKYKGTSATSAELVVV